MPAQGSKAKQEAGDKEEGQADGMGRFSPIPSPARLRAYFCTKNPEPRAKNGKAVL
jgi:hypothetical protein